MEGRIVGLNCGYYSVECDGVIYKVKARGAFRTQMMKPVVGDLVELDDEVFIINSLYPPLSVYRTALLRSIWHSNLIRSRSRMRGMRIASGQEGVFGAQSPHPVAKRPALSQRASKRNAKNARQIARKRVAYRRSR